jgi:hypothetical protein
MTTVKKNKRHTQLPADSSAAVAVPSRNLILLAVSFFEGAAVMVIELLGAKIIAPFEEFTGEDFTPVPIVNLQDALVLTDDKPNLELLNAPTILDWRKNKIKFTVEGLLDKGLPIYQ